MIETLFSPKGRIPRSTWWYIQLFLTPFIIVMFLVSDASFGNEIESENSTLLFASTIALFLIIFWISTVSAIKRLHDFGRSGWYYFGYLIASILFELLPTPTPLIILTLWMIIFLGFTKSLEGSKQYDAQGSYTIEVPKNNDEPVENEDSTPEIVRYCFKCGTRTNMNTNINFCQNCGTKLHIENPKDNFAM